MGRLARSMIRIAISARMVTPMDLCSVNSNSRSGAVRGRLVMAQASGRMANINAATSQCSACIAGV